jgi:hypothetical protein
MADENKNTPSRDVVKLKNFSGLILIAIAFIAMTILSWRKWPDILIDFGAQLYIPWRLSLGETLYRDVIYFAGGPFSQYFNAALFKIFGVSFTTLIVANLIIIALLLLLLYRFFLKISDQLTATAICLVIVFVFAFSEYLQVGNYNYVAPYAHEAVHGLVISIAAIVFFSNCFLRRSNVSISLAGICFGLVFMTKPDIFAALIATTIAAFFFHWLQERSIRKILKPLIYFLLCAAIPLAIAFFYFRSIESSSDAIRSVVWAWIPLLTTSAAQNVFYQSSLGLDDLVPNLILTVTQFFGYSFALILCAWASQNFASKTRSGKILSVLIFIGLLAAAFQYKWFEGARALLFFSPAVCAILIWSWRKAPEQNTHLVPAILWSVFGLALLAKMGAHCRFWHYGFYLAMPATVSAIYFVLWFLPRTLQRWNVHPTIFRAMIFCLLAIGTGRLVTMSAGFYSAKGYVVSHGPDKILSVSPRFDPTAPAMEAALNWIEENCPTNATLAALPEGVMLNYLSRRANPTAYNFILPVWQEQFGEEIILAAYEKNPPDYVALIHRDASEFGFKFFGKTEAYGLKTLQWINVHLIGHEPLQTGAFGIKIFKRKLPEAELVVPVQASVVPERFSMTASFVSTQRAISQSVSDNRLR